MKKLYFSPWSIYFKHNINDYIIEHFIFDKFIITNQINNADVVITFSHSNNFHLLPKLKDKGVKIIYYISETSTLHFDCHRISHKLLNDNFFDAVFGCIINDKNRNFYKYPFYLLNFPNPIYSTIFKFDPIIFNNINMIVKNRNLQNMKFCCLINSHDNGKTRSNIYKKLSTIKKIDCPGKLFNNFPVSEINKIGNVEYIKQYIFNICPENFKCSTPGYITEKIMNCCLGGAIPIYYGHLDDIDLKIFNKNRMILFDPFDSNSINNTYEMINDLMTNKDKLEKFYRQDIFVESAFDMCLEMKTNIIKLFDKFV